MMKGALDNKKRRREIIGVSSKTAFFGAVIFFIFLGIPVWSEEEAKKENVQEEEQQGEEIEIQEEIFHVEVDEEEPVPETGERQINEEVFMQESTMSSQKEEKSEQEREDERESELRESQQMQEEKNIQKQKQEQGSEQGQESEEGDDWKNIRINEVQMSGGTGKAEQDFVELYNSGERVVDMSGWQLLRKEKGSLRVFPDGSLIEPGAYFVWAKSSDGYAESIDADVSSTASIVEGDTLELLDKEKHLVGSVTCVDAGKNRVYVYFEEGWRWQITSTPGRENTKDPDTSLFPRIILSEVYPDPVEVEDFEGEFIEIYNPLENDVDLTDWSLRNASGKQISLSGSVPAFGWRVYRGGPPLNNRKEVVELMSPFGEVVDRIAYDKSEAGRSYSKIGTEWLWVCQATPERENTIAGYPGPRTIRLSEILPDPKEGHEEFIELYNYGKETVSLSGWFLSDAGNRKRIEDESGELFLDPGSYISLSRSETGIALNNTKEYVAILDLCGDVVDDMRYETSESGWSWVWNEGTWRITPYVTPGYSNKVPLPNPNARMRINEVFPNPEGDEQSGEYIELFHAGDERIDLSYWRLRDASLKTYTFPLGTSLSAGEYLVIWRDTFDIALNNGKESVELLDASGEVRDRMEYASAKEGIGWNWSEDGWRRSKFSTPGKENRLNRLPEIHDLTIPERVYVGVKSPFSVRARDRDGDKLSYRWEFGDEKKSYLRETSHRYEKKKNYTVILRVSDGIEEVYEEKRIKVIPYLEYDVKIQALMPNPSGKDTQYEWIELMNNEDEGIDLKDWKIATGKDEQNLIAHPIRESLYLPARSSLKIMRASSAFSLRNTSGSVALFFPNGDIADSMSYIKERIGEDEVFRLSPEGVWHWIIPFSEGGGEKGVGSVFGQEIILPGGMSTKQIFPDERFFLFSFERIFSRISLGVFPQKKEGVYHFTRTAIAPDHPWWFRCLVGSCRED